MKKKLESLLEELKIKNISKETKCWFIRCEKNYLYYDNFKEHGIAAIGHIDSLGYKKTSDFLDNIADAQDKLIKRISASNKDLKEESVRRIASKYINQSLTFINEIKENDYIITIGDDNILIGYAQKYFGISEEKLSVGKEDLKGEHYNIEMTLSLRRDVEWAYEIKREKLPPSLFKATLSHQTVYNFKDIHSLLHIIYPMYIYDNQVFNFSVQINQKNSLQNYQITKLFNLFNEYEFFIKNANKIKESNYNKLLEEFQSYDLTVKASFMSPGEAWAAILLNYDELVYAISIYSMLFGNKFLGIDGIIDKDIRHLIANKLLNKKEKLKDLELSPPDNEL